jgi:nitrite reductase/ring-hydroxylating ferredoxin subunit
MAELTRRQLHALLAVAAGSVLVPLGSACGAAMATVAAPGGVATLAFAQFPALSGVGGSVVVNVSGHFPIVVVRTAATTAAALSATCTHAGCILRFDAATDDVHCDCHNADFDLAGNVLRGPPPVPLPTYAATVTAEAITVAVG